MNRDELLDELTTDVLAYVMRGSFPERRLAAELKPDELDERFAEYEKLVDLHFVLRPEVVSFVEELPQRVRSIKTQTRDVQTRSRGGIRGRIDWNATVRERYSTNPTDRSLFVCTDRTRDYDVAENLVLKRLLAVIYDTLEDCQEYLEREYDWVTDRWRENLELVDTLRRIFDRNVHVTRIRDPEEYEPTERMLQRASESRSSLYREAASLLSDHRDSRAGDPDAIRELLDETTITPDDEETLFELYTLFRYVSTIESLREESFEMKTIESSRQEIARIASDDEEIVLYHDQSGSDRDLSFKPEPLEQGEEELSRSDLVVRESRSVAEAYFTDREFELKSGRPDVIVLEVRSEDRWEYLITEVKYSSRAETIRSGIKETLEYLAFLRRENEYVFPDGEDAFGDGWNGVLVIQDLDDVETASLDEQRSIKILQASELEAHLGRVLEQVLD